MINKSHPFDIYKAKSGKIKTKIFDAFDPDARVFVLSK